MSFRIYFLTIFIFTFLSISNVSAATFTVTKTADTDDGTCNADCSLREAILAANANGASADTINFNIAGGGVKTINITTGLPQIETSLTINGATQAGYFGKPMIEVNGDAAFDSFGFDIATPLPYTDISVTILAIALTHHTYGVYSRCLPAYRCDITLLGNFIGTDATGTVPAGNRVGVRIQPSENSIITIGGDGIFEGNLISGNSGNSLSGQGIDISYESSQYFHDNVQVKILGNKIGTNFDGDSALANSGAGVYVSEFGYQGSDAGDFTLTIGGTTALSRNIISGNGADGVDIRVDDATIIGNYIGTNAAGNTAMPNGEANGFFSNYAVYITAQDNGKYKIGGSADGAGNLISGNNGDAVHVSTGAGGSGTAQLTVQGNFLGTNAAGTGDLGNDGDGINISSSTNYTVNGTIGGVTTAERNIISGNTGSGISLGSGNFSVYGNYIGTDKDGTGAIPNDYAGINVIYNANVQIGGTVVLNNVSYDAGNLISGNDGNGIIVPDFAAFPVVIRRNKIGTNAAGTSAVPNTANGIEIQNNGSIIGSDTSAADGNIISGNGANGILLNGNSGSAQNTKVFRNFIGTNSIGGDFLPNGKSGIDIDNSPNNQIGLASNGITTNIISGNTERGVYIHGATATGNRVENNIIGLGIIGNDLGNTGAGVEIFSGNENFIGSSTGSANTIAFNAKGVWVRSGTDNEIRRNAIFSNDALGIDLDAAGVTPNDAGDGDTGANRKQNFPVINVATTAGISGSLNSTPNGNFTLDFYRVDACDASGNGEGRVFLGSALVAADGAGNGTFNFSTSLTLGQFVTATATVTNIVGADDTSEFSNCLAVTAPPTVSFSTANYTASEGAASKTIIVTRSGAAGGTVSVDYATTDGTATAGQDYTEKSGTLTFGDGETIKTFDIQITNDTIDETDETINLTLSNPTGGASIVSPSTAVLTLTDNDNPPTISITDVSKAEGNSGLTDFIFQISLSSESAKNITVNFATADGTADLGDYIGLSGQISFAAGETSKNLVISVIGDQTQETDQTFFVNLSNATNATISDAQGVGTILNDDTLYTIRGMVRLADLTPVGGVTIQLSGTQSAQTTTDANGRYIFQNLQPNGNFTVSPSAVGCTFNPVNRQYSNLANDVSNADFTAIPAPSRQVQIISGIASPGQNGTITVELVSQDNENSAAFSLGYDSSLLSNPQAVLGNDAQNAALVVDTSMTGKIGIHLSLPAGQTFTSGTRQIVKVTFSTAQTNAVVTPIVFEDAPMARQILDNQSGDVLANYVNGAISILGPTAANVSIGGRVRDAKGNGLAQVRVVLTDENGQTRTATTNSFGNYRFDGVPVGETYILAVSSRKYFFAEPTRIVNVEDNADDIDFVGEY